MKGLSACAMAFALVSFSGEAGAASDWPIVSPGTSLQRVGNAFLPSSLRASFAALPVICEDGWGDDGQINSPIVRFFATSDARSFAAVQCAGSDADMTAVFENTPEAIRTQSFAALREGHWTGTPLLDLVRIEPMTGVLISSSDPSACTGEEQRFTYRLMGKSFVLIRAEARPCGGTWATAYILP